MSLEGIAFSHASPIHHRRIFRLPFSQKSRFGRDVLHPHCSHHSSLQFPTAINITIFRFFHFETSFHLHCEILSFHPTKWLDGSVHCTIYSHVYPFSHSIKLLSIRQRLEEPIQIAQNSKQIHHA